MNRREGSERPDDLATALEAYRAAAHTEADAHFDEHALEAQRLRILQRIEQAGHPARVLRFPGAPASLAPSAPSNRRWISMAAAAGLLVGLLTGQLLHVMPGDAWVHRTTARNMPATPPATRMAVVPALAAEPMDDDDALLDAVDLAVRTHGAPELRALSDFTFAYESR
jgi:hypothetical protein